MSSEKPVIINIDNPQKPQILDHRLQTVEYPPNPSKKDQNWLLMLIGLIVSILLFTWLRNSIKPRTNRKEVVKIS